MFRVSTSFAGLALASFAAIQPAWSVEVYFFRGAGDLSMINKDLHFSKGLDEMAEILNREGIHSEVRRFEEVPDAIATIRARKPKTIALIGHSMGALASLDIAKTLRNEDIRIVYMGLIDIPGHFSSVTPNVEWVEDYYSDNPAFGRLLNAKRHPKAKAIHISGYMHNRLDDVPRLKQAMLSAVREVHAADTAPQFQQEPVWSAQVPQGQRTAVDEAVVNGNAFAAAPTGQNAVSPSDDLAPIQLPIAGQETAQRVHNSTAVGNAHGQPIDFAPTASTIRPAQGLSSNIVKRKPKRSRSDPFGSNR